MSNGLKIAFVTGGLQFGGTTTFLLNLVSGLQARGVSCAVFSLTKVNPFASEFAALGVPVLLSGDNTIFEDRLASIYAELSRFNPSAVIANIGADAYEVLRYVPQGVTRIGMVHDLEMNPRGLVPRYRDVLDGVGVVNSHLLEEIRSIAPGLTCRYLPHGIPMPKVAPRSGNSAAPLGIIYFGRLVEGKGTRLFPVIIDELHRRGLPFRWTIHGEGPERDYLRARLAAEIASGEVVMSSPLARDQLFPIVRQNDVFIMASEIEGGPLTLLEAMSLGLVPLCNDIPCLAQEVVNAENGFIIPREPVKYADVLSILGGDRNRLERMSAAARKTITERYSIEAMAARYIDFAKSFNNEPPVVSWPSRIDPKPILSSGPLLWLAQYFGIGRQLRRIIKRTRSS